MMCTHGQRGLSQCEQGGEVKVSRFCADVFYGQALTIIDKLNN